MHKLADRQLEICTEMLSNFVKPEKLGNCSAQELLSVDESNDNNLLKPEDMLFDPHVGRLATKLKGKHVVTKFLKKARSAFVQRLKYMQK